MRRPTQKEAAKSLFSDYTDETGNIDRFWGKAAAPARARILSTLYGEKVPKSKAAWGLFRKAMLDLYGATGQCLAAQDHDLSAIVCQEHAEGVTQ